MMTMISNVLFPFVLSIPIFFFFFLYHSQLNKQKLPLPPGPFSWPIVGNLLKIDPKKPHISLAELAKSYGPLMTLRLGSRLFVVASSPETAKEVYKTHDRVLSGRYVPEVSRRLPESFTSAIAVADPADEKWRAIRGTLHSSLFTPSALESSSQLRVDKANQMVEFLRSKSGQVVNITDVTYAAIINTWTGLLVSQDFLSCWDDVRELRASTRELVEYAIPGLPDLFPYLSWLESLWKRNIDNYSVAKGTMWGEILRRKRSAGNLIGAQDYMEVLINKSYNDDQINNLLTELLVTAETVAIAVEWAIAELIKNQETLAALCKELDQAAVEDCGGGATTTLLRERDLEKLPYLQAVIKEALRLHPPTPLFLPRRATESCEVMNYQIPKDCLVLVNLYTVATDPTAWVDEPLKFKPERFLSSGGGHKKNLDVRGTSYELLPFGGGRRVCSGYSLALKEMQLLIASLVHAFRWSLPGGKNPAELDMSEYFGTTLGLATPLQLVPEIKNDLKIQA